ncbi:MAG: hypothetical protein FWE20_10430 [Defluviitaleaceae bacterium]|nr:hypothetical protein [Defluviitaleaceae bacterium]
MDVFSNSPLQNIYVISGLNAQVTGAGFITTPTEFIRVYELLSHHPSWILNLALTRLMLVSQFNLILVGVIIAIVVYNKGIAVEDSTVHILKKQILTIFYFAVALLFVVSILGMVIGYIRYRQVSLTEEMGLIMNLYAINELWIPDIPYYIQALLGTLIHLVSYTVFGLLIGHILRDFIFASVSLLFIANYFFSLLFLYPISPLYFLPRISGYFIMMPRGFPANPSGSFALSMLSLLTYLILIIFISKKLIDGVKKRSNVGCKFTND